MSGAKTQPDDLAREKQFVAEVFPAEIAHIAKRRQGSDDELSQSPTVKNGLLGLAFSGGGIRSATFNLGVLQELHRRDLFKRVDLLSTVSGGGFIGSSLTSLMSRGRDFPFDDSTAEEAPAVSHLRNNSNYLVPRGILDYLRMFAVLLRGIILNFLVLVPVLLASSLVATLWYGPQLLSRLRYDETIERTFSHLEAADLGEAGLVVDVGRPVAPLLDLLETHALVEFAEAKLERRRNARVIDALLDRDSAYRDVTEPLITGTGSPAAPYTFRVGVTALQVAQRLVDTGRVQRAGKVVEPPGKIEEIRAIEQTLTRGELELGKGVDTADVDALLDHLTRETHDTESYLPQIGDSDQAHLFMVFVTRQTLADALEDRDIIRIIGKVAPSSDGEDGQRPTRSDPPSYTFTPGDDGERRYSLTQILQVF